LSAIVISTLPHCSAAPAFGAASPTAVSDVNGSFLHIACLSLGGMWERRLHLRTSSWIGAVHSKFPMSSNLIFFLQNLGIFCDFFRDYSATLGQPDRQSKKARDKVVKQSPIQFAWPPRASFFRHDAFS
jgi:hypothetical protein